MRRLSVALFAALLAGLAVVSTAAQETSGPIMMAEGIEFKNGDRYWIPMNTENNSLALFSESVQTLTIYNKTGAEITLNKIELALGEGMVDEEFTLLNEKGKREPLAFKETRLEAGKGAYAFRVRLFPVESGVRTATLTVTYNGDKTFTLKLAGRGRENTKFFSHGTTTLQKLFGAVKTDEIVSTAVGDSAGNIYFSGQATQIVDRFSTDIIYGRVNADGTLAWARLWNGGFMDRSPDSGQNAETGGTANSLALDAEGNLYLAGSTSGDKSNSLFSALVLKVDGKTGETIWEKLWRPEWAKSELARHNADAYALCVRDGRVFVTGSTIGNAEVLFLALNAADGATILQRTLDITPGSNDRGYAIAAHTDGSVVIGGLASDRAFLLKLAGCNGDTPAVAWCKRVDLGRASGINCVDLDADGSIYASLDRRGATTFFSAAKFLPNGALAWAKTYAGTAGDGNNTHLVRVVGDTVLVGGRHVASGIYDGDGLLVALDTDSGGMKWSAFYHTGTGPDEAVQHRIKGAFITGKTLTVVGQSYTGSRNGERYFGYWYNGINELEDYAPAVDETPLDTTAFKPVAKGESKDAKDAKDARQIHDLKDKLEWRDARSKTGEPSDGDIAVWQIALK
ncbi:MAG: hypothetical protein HS108_10475 [Planctomycetes bacterium]|jgi:hypothetical protein|nr:hypothetical protein [Planctomycetota bacterium]MCL4729013.1 hypothetical protein [Planctomycetota bacterium]